jgi:hypothetical protein
MVQRFKRIKVKYSGAARYRIIVEGYLEEDLSEFLAGMQIRSTHREDETSLTTLTGRISDQAELNGVVNSIFEMHLPILSVEALHDEAVHTDAEPDQKANEPE